MQRGMFSQMNAKLTPISRDHNKKLVKIIQTLLSYEQSTVFRKPIPHKALGWQNYKDIVKKPIDLNLVRRQYNEGKYKMVEQVLDDIQTIWENAFLYQKRQHQSFDTAIRMQKYFDDLLSDFYPEYFQKINRVIYFKQFEKNKPQKVERVQKMQRISNNGQIVQAADKIGIKAQRMDLQKSRNQMQAQRQVIANNKKQSTQSKRQQTLKEAFQTGQKRPTVEKIIQQVQKPAQINDPVNNMIQIEQAVVAPVISQPQDIQLNFPNVSVQQANDNESEQQNRLPPILVNFNQSPTLQQIEQITEMMTILLQRQQLQTLSKIVRILTKYQKQHMIIDGQDVNFKMNQIHISTYNRVKTQLQIKINQIQESQKYKQSNGGLNGKHFSKLSNSINTNTL